jgi:hypothetical protein
MKIVKCTECGNPVRVLPKEERSGRGKFCSRNCYYIYKHKNRKITKKNCDFCGKSNVVSNWKIYTGKKFWFCDIKCYWLHYKLHPELYPNPRKMRQKLESHPIFTKELLEKEYLENGLKMDEIAQKYNSGYTRINYWITKYGIPKKTPFDYLPKTSLSAINKMVIRKRGNQCEICGWDKTRCDVHHKIAQKDSGTHSEENLIVVCPNCHRMISENKLKI